MAKGSTRERIKAALVTAVNPAKLPEQKAVLGRSDGVIKVEGRKVYVTLGSGEVATVYNVKVPAKPFSKVVIGYDSKAPEVLQILRTDGVYKELTEPEIPDHRETHHPWGTDPLEIYPSNIVQLLPRPVGGMSVRVYYGYYRIDGVFHVFPTSTIDLSGEAVSSGAEWVNAEVDEDGVVTFQHGTNKDNKNDLTPEDIPETSATKYLLFSAKMYEDLVDFVETPTVSDIFDPRSSSVGGGALPLFDPYQVIHANSAGVLSSAPGYWYNKYEADFTGQLYHGENYFRASGDYAEVQTGVGTYILKQMYSISDVLTDSPRIFGVRGAGAALGDESKVLSGMHLFDIGAAGFKNEIGNTGSQTATVGRIEFVAPEDWVESPASAPVEIRFLTTPSGSTTRVLRATLTKDGDFNLETGGEFQIGGVPLSSMTTEEAEDIVGAMIAAGTQSGISVTYSDAGSSISFDAQTAGDARYLLATMLDTDGTLAANSDLKIASQKAVKTYVDTAVTGLLDFKGSTDASANPNYPAALKGDAYVVSVAGKVGGASGKSVEVGDVYVASADNAGGNEASVGTSWFVLEHNLQGAALVGASNTFTRGQFIDGSADEIQLRVQGHSAQTANIFTIEDSTAGVLTSVSSIGSVVLGKKGNSNSHVAWIGNFNAFTIQTDTTGGSPELLFKSDTTNRWYIGSNITSSGDLVFYGYGSPAGAKLHISSAGLVTIGASATPGTSRVSIVGSTDTIQLQVKASASQTTNLQTWETSAGNVLVSFSGNGIIASAAGATWNSILFAPTTQIISGSTNITTSNGFNFVQINSATLSSASPLTVSFAASLRIEKGPVGGGAGPTTITNSYALWIDDGTSRFDGAVIIGDNQVSTTQNAKLFIRKNTTPATNELAVYVLGTTAPGAGVTYAQATGVSYEIHSSPNATGVVSRMTGFLNDVRHDTSGTTTLIEANLARLTLSGGTVTTGYLYRVDTWGASGATVTNLYGLNFSSPVVSSGAVTNIYGIYINNITTGSTLNYAIYTNAGLIHFGDSLDLASGKNITMIAASINGDTTTGVKLMGAANQKLGIWGATPIVQPTTAIAAATFAANTSAIADDTATYDGYTLGQVVKALRNIGALA